MSSKLGTLEARLGYTYRQQSLLVQALTHRSHSAVNYERLEFLGDAILNFSIASELFARFEDATEGELSRFRASLVRRSTLAAIARELDLGEHLTMGAGEMKSGGFTRDSILSDTLEAIIGAIYLDGGITAASGCVSSLFASRLGNLSTAGPDKDAKSKLQEYLQGMGAPLPEYVLVQLQGKPPDQVFAVECRSGRLKAAIRATGTSRRRAEQSAADLALRELCGDTKGFVS